MCESWGIPAEERLAFLLVMAAVIFLLQPILARDEKDVDTGLSLVWGFTLLGLAAFVEGCYMLSWRM